MHSNPMISARIAWYGRALWTGKLMNIEHGKTASTFWNSAWKHLFSRVDKPVPGRCTTGCSGPFSCWPSFNALLVSWLLRSVAISLRTPRRMWKCGKMSTGRGMPLGNPHQVRGDMWKTAIICHPLPSLRLIIVLLCKGLSRYAKNCKDASVGVAMCLFNSHHV